MPEALNRILDYARKFSDKIEVCRHYPTFNAADWEDAYNRLSRLRDRYLHEKPNLDPAEAQALRKVFEEDDFIEDMLKVRQIGEHVHQGNDPSTVRLMTNATIPICVETSALGFFGAAVVRLPDIRGQLHSINHLQNLKEAEKRIQRALDRATNKLP
jgi:hypothetical protein